MQASSKLKLREINMNIPIATCKLKWLRLYKKKHGVYMIKLISYCITWKQYIFYYIQLW